ncbi:hypothetical protein QE152_g13253 [Popillia japonica]|uniref:Uncharacterized protein n=1 Tax=Popillia japonica TaxID=7064 RepID=A0AAW1LDT2_POPJA
MQHHILSSDVGYSYRRYFSEETIARFRSASDREEWLDLYSSDSNAQKVFMLFYDRFLYYCNSCFPVTKIRSNKKITANWYTEDLRRTAQDLRDLFHIYKSSNNTAVLEAYKKLKEDYQLQIQTSKTAFYDRLIQNSENRVRDCWNIINQLSGTKISDTKLELRDSLGAITFNPSNPANLFCLQFCNVKKPFIPL